MRDLLKNRSFILSVSLAALMALMFALRMCSQPGNEVTVPVSDSLLDAIKQQR